MLRADPKESLPEYAGKRVRYALVILELVNRKPVEIEEIQYSYLTFDAQGRLDPADFEKQVRLAMEVVGSLDSTQKRSRLFTHDTDLPKNDFRISTGGFPIQSLKPPS
jgi:hypothetical protein